MNIYKKYNLFAPEFSSGPFFQLALSNFPIVDLRSMFSID